MGMLSPRSQGEKERPGIVDLLTAVADDIVQIALRFRFANQIGDGHEFIGGRMEKELLFVIVQNAIGDRVGVRERECEKLGQQASQFPSERSQIEGLTA